MDLSHQGRARATIARVFAACLICLSPGIRGTALAQPPAESPTPTTATEPAPALTTLVLGSAEPYMLVGGSQGRLLPRELARQAALLAGREELGLATRDLTLREAAAEGSPAAKRIDVQTADFRGKRLKVQLIDPARKSSRSILDEEIALPLLKNDHFDYVALVVASEALSRSKMVDALRNAGFSGEPNKLDTAVAVPEPAAKHLGELNPFSQFAALRVVHALQRSQGESPATLGALARAYAHLGQLTQFHLNATHKAFKARSLLYAQRLVARAPDDAPGYWHRGYALAFAGLHQAALDDFAKARELSAGAEGGAAPAWARLAELHCRFDEDALAKEAREGADAERQLAWFLTYLTVEHDNLGPAYALTIGRQALEQVPDCFRIVDSMCDFEGVSNLHVTTTVGPQMLVRAISRRVRAIPEMPADLADFMRQMRTARIRNEPGEAWQRDICALFEMHPELIERLDQAADPARQPGEPSWSMLARLIDETTFVQLYRRIDFVRGSLGMPVDEMVKYAKPIAAEHPYHAFIDSQAIDYRRQPAKYWVHFKDLDLYDVELPAVSLIRGTWDTPHKSRMQGRKAWLKAYDHLDETNRELEIQLNNAEAKDRVFWAKYLVGTSPHNPLAPATLIRNDWENAGDEQIAKWSADYAQQPLVTGALAKQYAKLKRSDEAKEAYQRYIAKSPDQWAYVELADLYLDEGDVAQWNATLDEFLKQEDFALSHASVQVRIARYYMGQQDFEKARPYAEQAAQSGASWAMLCAADCLEGLGEFRAAEEYVAQNAGRYARQQPTWFFWCKRTGHGDLQQATALANEYFAQISPRATADDYHTMGIFNLMSGKELAARGAFRKAFQLAPEPYLAVHEALLADAAGEAAERDKALQLAIDTPVPKNDGQPFNEASIALAKMFQQALAGGDGSALTREKLDPVLDAVKSNGPGTIAYFTARFLETHGDQDLSKSYWERCAAQKLSLTHILGIERLRKGGL
ncbi:MAG: hypothetical protein JNG90_15665 [Planctomycetaceae bacterium]|nr:hypothetical protein [Planctomycetaceae bacterium]